MQDHSNIYEVSSHVAVIKITEPLDLEHQRIHLSVQLQEVAEKEIMDQDIRVIVITGNHDKAFSAEHRPSDPKPDYPGTELQHWSLLAEPVSKLEQPVIVAVMGDAVGQGLELVLACDIRVAAETSRFGLPHIKKGLIPFDGGTQRLSRLVGRGKTLEMILTGKTIDAREALRIGLVNMIVPQKEVIQTALEMAGKMAVNSPISLRYAKEAIYKGMDITLEQGLRLEADLYMLIHTTKDRQEGIRAFREKRKAVFKGE